MPYEKVKCGNFIDTQFPIPTTSSEKPLFAPVKLFEVSKNGIGNDLIGYYFLIQQVAMSDDQLHVDISWILVGFTDENQHTENPRNLNIPNTFLIQAKQSYVPHLIWPMRVTNFNELMEYINPRDNRPPSSFSIPVAFLQKYYGEQDGRCKLSIKFD